MRASSCLLSGKLYKIVYTFFSNITLDFRDYGNVETFLAVKKSTIWSALSVTPGSKNIHLKAVAKQLPNDYWGFKIIILILLSLKILQFVSIILTWAHKGNTYHIFKTSTHDTYNLSKWKLCTESMLFLKIWPWTHHS